MAAGLKQVREKINSVALIKKVADVTKIVSIDKIKKFKKRLSGVDDYLERYRSLLDFILTDHNPESLIDHSRGVLIVITSNKGLCGKYNSGILNLVDKFIANNDCSNKKVLCIGKVGKDHFNKHYPKMKAVNILGEPLGIVDTLLKEYIYQDKKFAICDVIYSHSISFTNREVVCESLAMLKAGSLDESPYEYDDNVKFLYEYGYFHLMKAKLYQFIIDASLSEHFSRTVAMNNASMNSDIIEKKLKLEYNKKRQAVITTEINEIIGGAEGVNG